MFWSAWEKMHPLVIKWTVTSDVAEFNLNLNASMPFDSLSASLNGQTVSGKVENPDADAKYVLATYFGEESGKGQYAIEYQDITDPANISAQIPNRGIWLLPVIIM